MNLERSARNGDSWAKPWASMLQGADGRSIMWNMLVYIIVVGRELSYEPQVRWKGMLAKNLPRLGGKNESDNVNKNFQHLSNEVYLCASVVPQSRRCREGWRVRGETKDNNLPVFSIFSNKAWLMLEYEATKLLFIISFGCQNAS